MPKQPAFPGKKQTRREKFLAEMDAVVPWTRLLTLIAPHYPKVGPKGGRPPMPLETMLRVYFLQQWYALSDPMAEEMLYDSDAMRQFAGIELGDDRIPDETTILNFRHLLEKHQLTEKLFVEVNRHLTDHGITLCSGTLVDATIIDAPSSTENEAKDPVRGGRAMIAFPQRSVQGLVFRAWVRTCRRGMNRAGIVHSPGQGLGRDTTARSRYSASRGRCRSGPTRLCQRRALACRCT